MDVDRARVAGERVAPDALEQLVAGEHEPAVVEQLPEQLELLRRELDLAVADHHLAAAGVDQQVAVPDLVTFVAPAVERRAAEDALHARDELAGVEGLRQVVVGADLEPDDLVDILVAGGQHQDRHVRSLAHAAADLDAVHVGQVEIEDDQRRHLGGDRVQRRAARSDRLHDVAGVLQIERDERGDRRLVLDDEDRLRSGHGWILTDWDDGAPRHPARTTSSSPSAGNGSGVGVADRVHARCRRPRRDRRPAPRCRCPAPRSRSRCHCATIL